MRKVLKDRLNLAIKQNIASSNGVAIDKLISVDVSLLELEFLSKLCPEPKACFSNAYKALLGTCGVFHSAVFGYAAMRIGNCCIPIEHVWLKGFDGKYYDPTYQANDNVSSFFYFSLIELAPLDYLSVLDSDDTAVEHLKLRLHKNYKNFFINEWKANERNEILFNSSRDIANILNAASM